MLSLVSLLLDMELAKGERQNAAIALPGKLANSWQMVFSARVR